MDPVNTQTVWILSSKDIALLQNEALSGSTTASQALVRHYIMSPDKSVVEGSRMKGHLFWLAHGALQGDSDSLTAFRQHEAMEAAAAASAVRSDAPSPCDAVLWPLLGCSFLLNVLLVAAYLKTRRPGTRSV